MYVGEICYLLTSFRVIAGFWRDLNTENLRHELIITGLLDPPFQHGTLIDLPS